MACWKLASGYLALAAVDCWKACRPEDTAMVPVHDERERGLEVRPGTEEA